MLNISPHVCVLVMICYSTCVCWLWMVAARVCADMVNCSTCVCWLFVAARVCAGYDLL